MPVFLDSNIVLYALGNDLSKRVVSTSLLAQKPIISTQVINECSHVLRRKRQYLPADVSRELSAVIKAVKLVDVGIHEIHQAWAIAEKYGFSHYDSLIIAASLASGCSTLFSEDLQHEQVIDSKLTICNPFLNGHKNQKTAR